MKKKDRVGNAASVVWRCGWYQLIALSL